MNHKCGLCEGSGKIEKVYFRFRKENGIYLDGPIEIINSGEHKNCPGCDGSGVSVLAKIKNGEMEAPKEVDLKNICEKAVNKFPKEVALFKAGKEKVIGRLVKDVLTESNGRADPVEANKILKEIINGRVN